MSSTYQLQDRGDLGAYTRYLANMDAAMRQKVALTAAHLPCQGTIADMGMGSGSGSHALAALYPRLRVEGVDVNPTMVEVASQHYQLPNLAFRVGDIAEPCFAPASLDGIVNSSVLHHVTSYNGYDYQRASSTLEAQVKQLALGGTLVVRDFLAPPPGQVELRIPQPLEALWKTFSSQFRALLPEEKRGFAFEDCGRDERGWLRLRVEHRLAVEFVLRKDYTQDWDQEIQEEYTYFTQSEFEQQFAQLGLRVLVSTPLHNPWIVENRFEGQFEIYQLDGQLLDFPPTNYLIVGEKVAPGQGVGFLRQSSPHTPEFLRRACYRHQATRKVYDLVCRPHPTVDVLPFTLSPSGNLSVLVRHSYPRPILTCLGNSLDGMKPSPYVVEPITAVQGEDPVAETVEQLLLQRCGVKTESIQRLWSADVHFPSPGGIREEVISCFAEILDDSSGHSWLRSLDAHQLMRSAQVNGLSDHRLEMHIFSLMRQLKIDAGPWLGDSLARVDCPAAPRHASWEQAPARVFLPTALEDSPGFLEIRRSRFQERDETGRCLQELDLEYVLPGRLSSLTVALLPMQFFGGEWWVGLDLEDLPAAQAFSGSSRHWIAPAWRLPPGLQHWRTAWSWLERALEREYAATLQDRAPLGGPYFPSPGLTPELVYPMAVRVACAAETGLSFFPLNKLMEGWESIQNGHLRCLLLRAYLAHRSSGEGE